MKTFSYLWPLLMLAGCDTTYHVYTAVHTTAVERCARNEGLQYVVINRHRIDVRCNDGAYFYKIIKPARALK